jgi:dTMP kinase
MITDVQAFCFANQNQSPLRSIVPVIGIQSFLLTSPARLTKMARSASTSKESRYSMKRSTGHFIVLEGLDGSGTTTQAALLHDYLTRRNRKSHLTCEPTDEPVGKLIRDALSGRLTSPGTGTKIAFCERARCLLFAADRQEHSMALASIRAKGKDVICDRYILSSIAYQTLDDSIKAPWVIDVNRGCAVPNLTLLLDVPVKECMNRLSSRKDRPTVYEKRQILTAIEKNYIRTLPLYKKHFGPVRRIDGHRSIEAVHDAIVAAVESALKL